MTNRTLQISCSLPNGIHARPASHLEKACAEFACQITLTNLRNGNKGNAKSVLSIVGTDTLLNDEFTLTFEGCDAPEAHAALERFMEDVFPYCDEPLANLDDNAKIVLPQSLMRHNPELIKGNTLAKGIGAGVLVEMKTFDIRVYATPVCDNEADRFARAKAAVVAALQENLQKADGEENAILDAHLSIANDPEFTVNIEKLLVETSVANAVLAEVERVSAQLSQSSSAYLQERVLDIRDVAGQLLAAAYPDVPVARFELTEPSIVIAEDLTPSQFLSLDRGLTKGLVLTHAGKTSHTVILARAFGIPTLSGISVADCEGALGTKVYLHAELGVVAVNANLGVEVYFDRAMQLADRRANQQKRFAGKQGMTRDGKRIEVAANIACAVEAEGAFNQGAEGVGLFRTEMLFMDRASAPTEEEQFRAYSDVLKAAEGKPIIIRTMDIGGDKPIDYLNLPAEQNPFLGYRAVRIYPQFLNLFRTQLRAILRAACCGHARVMVPMIQSIEEIRWVKEQMRIVANELSAEGLDHVAHIELGIMVEVPAVAFMIDQFSKEVDFFSIGSNDMTQYLLAVDRDNDQVSSLYNSMAPSFLRMLRQVVDTAHANGRWVGLCGELGADARVLPLLVGAGLDEVSMSAPNIPATKALLAELDSQACRTLFDAACDCATIADVVAVLDNMEQNEAGKSLLDTECVFKRANFRTKEEAIQALVGNLALTGRTDAEFLLEEDIWAREAVFSTGLGFGFAIPHTKSENIRHSSISIAQLESPINWQSDSGDVDFIIMLTLNKDQGDQHMRIFSSLARKLIHADFRERLREAEDEAAVIAMLREELAL